MRGTERLQEALMPKDAKKAIAASLFLSFAALLLLMGFMMGQAASNGSRNAH